MHGIIIEARRQNAEGDTAASFASADLFSVHASLMAEGDDGDFIDGAPLDFTSLDEAQEAAAALGEATGLPVSRWSLTDRPNVVPDSRPVVRIGRRGQALPLRWVDDVEVALKILGGEGHLREIWKVVRFIRRVRGEEVSDGDYQTFKIVLPKHCRHCAAWAGRDIFRQMGQGRWRFKTPDED